MKTIVALLILWATMASAAEVKTAIAQKPLDEQIRFFQQAVRSNPKDIGLYNQLAYAYIRKVRATADQDFSVKAEKLLDEALAMDGSNYDSLSYLALVQMSQHRFADSRASAQKAVDLDPDMSTAYGVLGDASYELGLYQDAADAYQKMMDIRPSAAAYGRVFYYRRLIGDVDGAGEMLKMAISEVDPTDPENRAWCLLQLGNLAFGSGKLDDAEQIYNASLQVFPNYYNALAGLARVKAAQGKIQEAITNFEKAIAIVPMPEFVASLGDLYAIAGRIKDSEQQFELVEYIGLISKINQEVYNRQLAMFYADHDRKPDEALKLASAEIENRKDIYGYDALAWCLYKNGKNQEARAAIKEALKMGTQDALLFYHAGMINDAAGQKADASKYLKTALSINPYFHPLFAWRAIEKLAALDQTETKPATKVTK